MYVASVWLELTTLLYIRLVIHLSDNQKYKPPLALCYAYIINFQFQNTSSLESLCVILPLRSSYDLSPIAVAPAPLELPLIGLDCLAPPSTRSKAVCVWGNSNKQNDHNFIYNLPLQIFALARVWLYLVALLATLTGRGCSRASPGYHYLYLYLVLYTVLH